VRQCFNFRGDVPDAVALRAIERLDADVVAADQEFAVGVVEQDEAEHPVELRRERRAVLNVCTQDHFGVTRLVEKMAARGQLAAQLLVIVDLSVQDNMQVALGIGYRLARMRALDDRETVRRQAEAFANQVFVEARRVSSMRDLRHQRS
jgi:hypothetical protein